MTATARPEDARQWRRLGRALRERRVALGYRNRAAFARKHGISDRTLGDLENAKRTNFDEATLITVEVIYEWRHGSVADVLAGRAPTPLVDAVPIGAGSDPSRRLLAAVAGAMTAEDIEMWQALLADRMRELKREKDSNRD